MNARTIALEVLGQVRTSHRFAADLIDERLRERPLPDRDRRLLMELVLGVLRRRSALEAMTRPYLKRSPDAVVRDLLDIGAYQIAYLDQIPARAAVSESVELAKRVSPAASGFVNGVLRRVCELVMTEEASCPATDAVPLKDGRYRRLTRGVFPDPNVTPAKYLATAFTWPGWLAKRWLDRFGWEECLRLGFWFVTPPSIWLRVNPLRTTRDILENQMSEAGLRVEPGEHPQSLRLRDRRPIVDLAGYAEGLFCVQDVMSMGVASALNPAPGMRVLDLCTAPGGKTTHLAELMENQGRIVACDANPARLATVRALSVRLGLTIIEPTPIRPAGDDIPEGPFDAALVDVPCSNTGVLGRRPEVRHRLKHQDLAELVPLQVRLLAQAVERVRPEGVIVYSTCSIEPEENRGVVETVRTLRGDVVIEAESEAIPGTPSDGGYWARLRRTNRS